MHILELSNVSKVNFPFRRTISSINLTVDEGDIVLINGPKGSGKSTLAEICAGILMPNEGKTENFGKIPGIVSGDAELLPELKLFENAALPLLLSGINKKESCKRAKDCLRRFGLGNLVYAKSDSISIYEAAVAKLVAALITEPSLLILDEIEADLSESEQGRFFALLNREYDGSLMIYTSDETLRKIFAEKSIRYITIHKGRMT